MDYDAQLDLALRDLILVGGCGALFWFGRYLRDHERGPLGRKLGGLTVAVVIGLMLALQVYPGDILRFLVVFSVVAVCGFKVPSTRP